MIHATATAQARMPHATTLPTVPPPGSAAAGEPAWPRTAPQHPSVWDERARKMGFPPSTR